MPVPIAELFISVSADVSAAITGLNSLNSQVSSMNNTFNQARPVALAFAATGAAIGAGFAGSIKTAADFEQAMANVQSIMSPADAQQFGAALSDLGLRLGRDTVFTAREAADAIGELIKAGVPAESVLNGAADAAVNLAIATGVKGAEAATIMSQALNGFQLSASRAASVTDTLAGVVNVSAADMGDLHFGLQAVGPVAAGIGLSFEDTAAALGIFANNALRGQDAGTSLKTMLLNLIPQTKQEIGLFNKLGITTNGTNNQFFDATGKVKDLAGIAGVLRNALKGMSDEQRTATLQLLFGTDAVRAANILYRTGAAGVRQFQDEVGQIHASDVAETRLNTLDGALQNLGGSLETVQIIIGRFFLPLLRGIADAVREPLNAFTSMSPAAQLAATALIGISGAVATALGGMVLLAPVIANIGPAFAAFGSVLIRVAPFFGLLGLAAAGLFAAWQANLFGIRDLVARAFDAIPSVLDRVGTAIGSAGTVWENSILPAILTIGNQIERTFIPVFNDAAKAISDFWNRTGPILGDVGLAFQKAFSGDITGALDTFRAIILAAVPGAAGFVALVANIADAVGRFAVGIGDGLVNFFTVTLPPVLDTLGQFAGGVGGAMLDFFNSTLAPIASTAASFAGDVGAGLTVFFTQTLPPILDQVAQFAGDIGTQLLAFFRDTLPVIASTAGQFAGDVGSGLLNFFTVTMPPILDEIAKFSADATAPLAAFFNEHLPPIIDTVGRFATDTGAGMVNFFVVDLPQIIAQAGIVTADTFASVVKFFDQDVPRIIAGANTLAQAGNLGVGAQGISAFFANFDAIKEQVQSLEPFFNAIGNFATALGNLGAAVTGLASSTIGNLLKTEFELIGNTVQNFANQVGPVQATVDTIGQTVETLGRRIQGVTDFINAGADAINKLADSIRNAPPQALPGAGGAGGFGLNPDLFNGNATPDTPIFKQTAFVPGAGGGAAATGGPLIAIGTLIIGNEADRAAFLAEMAEAINAATRRVAPPVPPGQPGLVSGVI